MLQVVVHQSSKHTTLSSTPSTAKKKKINNPESFRSMWIKYWHYHELKRTWYLSEIWHHKFSREHGKIPQVIKVFSLHEPRVSEGHKLTSRALDGFYPWPKALCLPGHMQPPISKALNPRLERSQFCCQGSNCTNFYVNPGAILASILATW